MFEDYLRDSYAFLSLANKAARASNDGEARRYYRASILFEFGAIEAFVNYIAVSFLEAGSLSKFETSFLNDKAVVYSVKKGVHQRTEYHSLDSKLRLLLRKFIPDFDFQSTTWTTFMELKELRNDLMHPRQPEDETSIEEYHDQVADGLKEAINLMNIVSKGIFKKPLRNQLLDLVPD